MFDKKAYIKKWQQENKDKVAEYNRRWIEKNKEKFNEIKKNWRKNNPEKVKENDKKSHQRFIETHNWVQYCAERRKIRIQRLREQGVKNPWAVINGGKPKYKEKENE